VSHLFGVRKKQKVKRSFIYFCSTFLWHDVVTVCDNVKKNKGVTKEGVTTIWGEKKNKRWREHESFLQSIFVTWLLWQSVTMCHKQVTDVYMWRSNAWYIVLMGHAFVSNLDATL
jgi:hypothetical protein